MKNSIKKLITALVLAVVVVTNFAWVKPADAILGVADISVVTTVADVPRMLFQITSKIANIFLQRLKSRMLTMLQNDLVNWVQGGGKPRFITDPKKFFKQAADVATVGALDEFFKSHGSKYDVCSTFKPQLLMMVSNATLLPERKARCSLSKVIENVQKFSDNFNNGGWTTWAQLHQTQNTMTGSYLAATEFIGSRITVEGNSVTAQISAGKGFLDQKTCLKATMRIGLMELSNEGIDRLALESVNSGMSDAEFARQVTSGEAGLTETIDFTAPPYNKADGVPMNQVPQNATCIESKTTTPGSVIGDQISGALKGTGIDKILGANDLAQIINAVIDAAVNRVAREGLSLMKSGSGSYTRPARGTYTNRLKSNTDNVAMEGMRAAELLNNVIGFRTKTDSLTNTLKKSISEARIDDFKKRLTAIPEVIKGNVFCKGRRDAGGGGTGNAIDGCFFGNGYYIDKSWKFGLRPWPDLLDLSKEEQNPGAYIANQIFYQELAKIWNQISDKLEDLKNKLATKDSCKIPDVAFTLNTNADNLPFAAGDGRVFNWAADKRLYIDEILPPSDLNDRDKDTVETRSVTTEASNWKIDLGSMIASANGQKLQSESAAKNYGQLIDGIKKQITAIDDDKKFADGLAKKLMTYASVLMDYDVAGSVFGLSEKIKIYNDVLNNTKKTEDDLQAAKQDVLLTQAKARTRWKTSQEKATGEMLSNASAMDDQKEEARQKLAVVSEAIKIIEKSFILPKTTNVIKTRPEDVKITDIYKLLPILESRPVETVLTTQLNPGDLVVVKSGEKMPAEGTILASPSAGISIDETVVMDESATNKIVVKNIWDSVFAGTIVTNGTVLVKVTNVINDPTQLGTSASDAVSQAMQKVKDASGQPLLSYGVSQIIDELEIRDSNISRLQIEATGKISQFPTDMMTRIDAGTGDGEGEWDKYFTNRTHYVYSSMILDFFTSEGIKIQNEYYRGFRDYIICQ